MLHLIICKTKFIYLMYLQKILLVLSTTILGYTRITVVKNIMTYNKFTYFLKL